MVQNDTLFAHLAPRIAGGAENAAVEALAYILNGPSPQPPPSTSWWKTPSVRHWKIAMNFGRRWSWMTTPVLTLWAMTKTVRNE